MANATLILAEVGAGKTSLLDCILKDVRRTRGQILLNNCRAKLEQLNKDRKIPFELPTEPPIYTDITSFKTRFKIGYDKWYEPFGINPYYMGVKAEGRPTQFVLPYAQIFIPEIQKYGDSRKSTTFPRSLSRVFEIRRHWHIDFYMDGHKGNFIDLKIRAMCNRVIDLVKQEHDYDGLGRIIKTRWICREFPNIDAYDAFYDGADVEYKDVVYENEGNIFNDYDSFGCANEFVPPEGVQFSMLKPVSAAELKTLPKEIAQYYSADEPSWFRKKEK